MTRRQRRILFVTQTAHPWGGVETWLSKLVPHLETEGWEATVGLVRGARYHRPEAYLARNSYDRTIEIPCLTATPEGRVGALRRAIAEVRPDVVAPVNVGDVLEAAAREAEDGRPVRLLYTLHGLGVDYLAEAKEYSDVVTRAVTASRLAGALLRDVSGLEDGRVGHARYGADRPRRLATESPGPLRIGFVGRIEQGQKRALDVAVVARALRAAGTAFRLVVAGGGPQSDALRSEIDAIVPRENLDWRGPISTVEVYEAVYPELDVLLVTSSWETGPMVAWEAMLHGVPLVTSQFVGLKAEGLLRDGENCLTAEVSDTDGLARCLRVLASDRSLRRSLGQSARKLAEAELTWDVSLPRWVAEVDRCFDATAPTPMGRAPRMLATGRLDRVFGPRAGETIRRLLGRRGYARDSGAEWPHSIGAGGEGLADLQELARVEAWLARNG